MERSPDEYEHFKGVCSFHKGQTCLEGMVNNKSIAERLQVDFTALADLPDNARIWQLVGFYLAQLCLNITLLVSPEVIVIGGGIMNRRLLYSIIQDEFRRLLGGYVDHPLLSAHLDNYIVSPRLGSDVGVKGAMALATIRD